MSGEKAIFIDSSLCIGCHSCAIACKMWNRLPAEHRSLEPTYDKDTSELSASNWLAIRHFEQGMSYHMRPMMCLHCSEASCLASCPEDAIIDENGWKVIDQERCIGCGACEAVCPYKAVFVEPIGRGSLLKKKAYKCDGCRGEFSKIPQCVENCPTGALRYDFRLKLFSFAQKRLEEIRKKFPESEIIGIHEYRGMNVLALLTTNERHFEPYYDKIRSISQTNSLYKALSLFAGGGNSVKQAIYRFAKWITGRSPS